VSFPERPSLFLVSFVLQQLRRKPTGNPQRPIESSVLQGEGVVAQSRRSKQNRSGEVCDKRRIIVSEARATTEAHLTKQN